MQIRILGSSAGGGLPQWNCRCPNCEAARAGAPEVRPRTQSSVAISADGSRWFLLNVSPDVRQQILAFPALGPPAVASRGTAIAGCVLTDAELDHTAGLWLLREGSPFGIVCTAVVRRWLNRYVPIEPILECFSKPAWAELPLETPADLSLPDGRPSGLQVQAFETGRHIPRFVLEESDAAPGAVIGLQVQDLNSGGRLVYAPCTAALGEALRAAAEQADCLLLDGTFWSDHEPIRSGIGRSTARGMGHVPVSGPGGSLDWLAGLPVRHRAYVHINNTNPMLNQSGPEHRLVVSRGVHVASDGDVFDV